MRAQSLGAISRYGLLLLVALECSHAIITQEEQEMLDWIRREGGDFKVTISRTSTGVRGIFTTENVRKGDVLIRIPDHLVLSVRNIPAAEAAPVLLRELHTPCSRLTPYLRIFPNETQVLTGYNFPDEYIKYLADDHLEAQVQYSFKRHCQTTLEGQNDDSMAMTIPEAIGSKKIGLPYFEYVVSLLSSRTFSLRKEALSMVPLLDLMNHDARDINQLDSSNIKESGVRLIAGKDLAAGEEVTITYGDMRSDELMLYYGFLDTVTQPPRLFTVDERGYKPFTESQDLDKDPLIGSEDAVREEIIRLTGALESFARRLKALGPIPETIPYIAGLLRDMHQQRRDAIRSELSRLHGLLRGNAAGSEL